jgi:hypothetical protein
MNTLTERMHMKFGKVDNAHIITNVHLGFAYYDTLCLICAELNIKLQGVSDSDFDSCAMTLMDFMDSAKPSQSDVSVWFDEE